MSKIEWSSDIEYLTIVNKCFCVFTTVSIFFGLRWRFNHLFLRRIFWAYHNVIRWSAFTVHFKRFVSAWLNSGIHFRWFGNRTKCVSKTLNRNQIKTRWQSTFTDRSFESQWQLKYVWCLVLKLYLLSSFILNCSNDKVVWISYYKTGFTYVYTLVFYAIHTIYIVYNMYGLKFDWPRPFYTI